MNAIIIALCAFAAGLLGVAGGHFISRYHYTESCLHPYQFTSPLVSSEDRIVIVSRLAGEPRGYHLTNETRRCIQCGSVFATVRRSPHFGLTFVGEPEPGMEHIPAAEKS